MPATHRLHLASQHSHAIGPLFPPFSFLLVQKATLLPASLPISPLLRSHHQPSSLPPPPPLSPFSAGRSFPTLDPLPTRASTESTSTTRSREGQPRPTNYLLSALLLFCKFSSFHQLPSAQVVILLHLSSLSSRLFSSSVSSPFRVSHPPVHALLSFSCLTLALSL